MDATASTAPANAHEARGNDCHLGRTAGRTAHQGEGKIIDEMGKSAVFQKCTENDEQENIGRRYTDTGAQKALGAPELGNEHTLQRKSVMSQISRQVSAKPIVRQEQGRQNGQISRSTPGCFKYADNGYKGDADFQTADASSLQTPE